MAASLSVESVSKCFTVQRKRLALLESMVQYLARRHGRDEILWALRDVTFSVERGQVFGIIGHNGAGKSALLRLLCGLGLPTSGSIERRGYVSGLLDLGSGLSHDMTGRENIVTVGILNGLSRKEIMGAQEEIIAFAELEDFIDQPVRTYSSGMYLRLAFAAALHFNPDVLLIDEVLTVGDARFQEKCVDRLNAFRVAGKTLVLVSHDTEQVQHLCDKVLVLEEGRVATQAEPKSAVACYNDLMGQRSARLAAQLSERNVPDLGVAKGGSRLGTQEATIRSVQVLNQQGRSTDTVLSGDDVTVALEYRLTILPSDLAVIVGIYSETGVKCFEAVISSFGAIATLRGRDGTVRCCLPKVPLLAGRYYINVGLYPTDWSYCYDYHWNMHVLRVESPNGLPPGVSGVISVRPVWSV